MKTNVLGVQYDNVTMAEALDTARALLQRPEASYCVTPNAEMAYEALHDESFRAILNGASLVLPDGAGVVLGAKILKTPKRSRASILPRTCSACSRRRAADCIFWAESPASRSRRPRI